MTSLFRASLPIVLGLAAALALPAQEKEKGKYKQDPALKKTIAAAQAAFDSGDWAGAAKNYTKVVELAPENPRAWHHLGYSLHALGKLDAAMKAHKKATKFPEVAAVATYNIACIYSLRGNKDEAFAWLDKAVDAGFAQTDHIATDTDMDNLREDPRFAKFMKSLHAAPASAAFKPYIMTTPRASTRLSFWGKQGSPGQLVIDYGQPEWKDSYAKSMDSDELKNKRWRLGSDFWTTLDTNVPVTIGDTEIAAGQYYLTLEHTDDNRFVLALLEPEKVRKQKLDAYLAHLSKGGIEVELKHKVIDEPAKKLTFGMKVEEGSTEGKLWIAFGPHALVTPIAAHVK